MSKVLIIKGTMSSLENSRSEELLNVFMTEYTKNNPKDEITTLDLNDVAMANITLNRHNGTGEFWAPENTIAYIDQLKSVDKVIVVSPMHNNKITTMLSNYLDHIMLPNVAFTYKFSQKGEAKGLLSNLKVINLLTQGSLFSVYPWADMAKYLENSWKFVGANVVPSVLVDGTDMPENQGKTPKEIVSQFEDKILKAAKAF
ncbi:FMN-dependent NADH-azoreductase [Mesoplasma photuris]|uniref:FMN-dependent NADH-azoreductase n=1 Tax=Mesoplasma photuris TaxID=217731 RepID=UPI0004E0D960|nr:FMN-dependent NADH-azoreductase [Mesoplasma photuris]